MPDHLSHTSAPLPATHHSPRTATVTASIFLTISLLLAMGVTPLRAASILSTVQFDWSYDTSLPGLVGYTIYQEGQPITNITNPNTLSAELDVYLEPGAQNLFAITAYDNLGNESNPSPPIIFDVPPEDDTGNVPPVANIELSTLSGPAPLSVDVDGSKSIDYDGLISSYAWNFGDGGFSNYMTDYHVYDVPGTYTVVLEVTDDAGAISSIETILEVTDPQSVTNQPPTPVLYASTESGPSPLDVLFDGSDSTDSDGTIVDYAWDFGDGSSGNGIFVNYTYNIIGTFTGKLTVTDDGGATAADQTAITVVASDPLNNLPAAVISASPVSGASPLTTTFSGSDSSDSDGVIVAYAWDFGDGSAANGADVSHQYATAGTYTATLTVTDDSGGTDAAKVIITVEEVSLPTTVVYSDDFATDSSSLYNNISGTLSVADGTAHGSSWQTTVSYRNLSLGANDHWIEAEVEYNGISDSAGLIGRFDPVTQTGYAAYFAAGKINLNHFAGAGQSWLASADTVYTAGAYGLRMVITGSNIKVYVDGVLKIDKTDSTYSQGLFGGFRIYRGSGNEDVTADNLRAGVGSPPSFPQQNSAPVAQNTSFTTPEDTPMNGTFTVSDLDGDPLTTTIVTNGSLGTVTITDPAANTYTYTPEANANGSDSFTYKANDGSLDSNVATVSITISAVNDPPVAQADSASTNEEVPITIDVLANDSDIDGDPLGLVSVGTPSHGTATISNNQVLYTPAVNYQGTDSFSYQVTDNQGGTATSQVNITVIATNDPPTASDGTLAVAANTATNGSLVASDLDGDPLTYTIVSNGSLGSAVITDPATGAYIYTPGLNAAGTDTFTFQANDGSLDSNIATITVTIEATAVTSDLSDDFSLDSSANYSAIAGGMTVAGGVAHGQNWQRSVVYHNTALAASDHWVEAVVSYSGGSDSAGLAARVNASTNTGYIVSFAAGRLNLNSFAGTSQAWVASQDGGYGAGTYLVRLVMSGSLIQVYVDGVLKIERSDATYLAGDHAGLYFYRDSANTDVTADNFTASISTAPPQQSINNAPVATDSTLILAEDTSASATLTASDPEGDALTYTIINNGSLGTAVLTDPATGAYTYTPSPDANGNDLITFSASDGSLTSNTASVAVTITAVNDPPVAADDTASGREDETSTIAVLANDTDVDNDTLELLVTTVPLHGTALVSGSDILYSPGSNFFGEDSFGYTITDAFGAESSAVVTITIAAVNDAPVAEAGTLTLAEDSQANGILVASDIENDPLTYAVTNNGALGSAVITNASTGAYTYTPNANASGTDSFSFTASDGSLDSVGAPVTVTITPVNDPPLAVADTLIIDEEQTALIAVLSNDNDVDGDTLIISSLTAPLHGSAEVSGDSIFYTPASNYSGSDSFTYTISDPAGVSASAEVAVTINAVNDAPVAEDGTLQIKENTSGSSTLVASDGDGDALTFSIISNGSLGTAVITDATTGAYTYTANAGAIGTDNFTFQASDGQMASNIANITITIEPVVVTGAISDDFSVNTSGDYTSISGSLTVSQGAAHGQNWRRTVAYHTTDLGGSDHWVAADVEYNGGADSAGVMARVNPTDQTGYFVYFSAGRIHLNSFRGTDQSWVASHDGGFSEGTYRVRVAVNASTIEVYVHDVLQISTLNTTYASGNHAGIYIYRDSLNTDVTADNFQADLLSK